MKSWLIALLLGWPACLCAFSQTAADREMRTRICEIAKAPAQFQGKLVTVRAQIWSAYDRLWLNDSVAGSLEFNRFCGWLPAEFAHPTDLGGSRAFGTFTGRVVIDQRSSSLPVRFVVEREKDIYRQEILVGRDLLPRLSGQTFVFRSRDGTGAGLKHPISRPTCQQPSSPPALISPTSFPVAGPQMLCGYNCDDGVPIRFCTKGEQLTMYDQPHSSQKRA